MDISKYFSGISEKEYRALDRVSYSFLKVFSEVGPKAIIEGIPEVSGPGLTLGSIVDKRLSDVNYCIEDEYVVSDRTVDFSGDTHISKVYKFLKDNKDIVLEESDQATLNRIFGILEFKRNPTVNDEFWKDVAVINQINQGVNLVPQSEVDMANTMINTLQTHKYTTKLFSPDLGVESYNQVAILFEYRGVKCKALIDKVLIDHNLKKIYLYDIKTGARYDFMDNFYKYKYMYQGGFYWKGFNSFIASIPELSDYSLDMSFSFIYISRENPYLPLVYKMDFDYIAKVNAGYETASGYKVKGIKELLEDYAWYKQNGVYDIKREIYESNGVVAIQGPK